MMTIGNYLQQTVTSGSSFFKTAVMIGLTTVFAGGAVLQSGVSRNIPQSNASLNDQNIAASILSKELSSGCVTAGSSTGCVMVVVGVTNNNFIFDKSGGLILGSFANPTIVASGSNLKIGGGYPARKYFGIENILGYSGATLHTEQSLTSSGTLKILSASTFMSTASGASTLTLSPLGGAALNHALCPKTKGVIGYCSTIVGADGSCTCN